MNHVIAVYGASSGIGAATIEVLINGHYEVIALSRHPRPAVWCDYKKLHWITYTEAPDDTTISTIRMLLSERGLSLKGLVLNAGAITTGSVLMSTRDTMLQMMQINFFRHVFLFQKLAPYLIRAKGSVVGVSSSAVKNHSGGRSAYAASKSALESFLLTAAHELGGSGIRVNVIRPGLTQTNLMEASTNEAGKRAYLSSSALGKIASPTDQAAMIYFLLSDSAEHITATTIDVDGGSRV